MATTYTTSQKVAQLLQIQSADLDTGDFGASTNPLKTTVERWINWAEDEIDRITGHAWRTRYSGTTTGADTTQRYEYYDIELQFECQLGIPIKLKNRKITTLASGSGDAFEVWNGNSYDDYLADKTEGRASDFWLDYEEGVIYLINLPYVNVSKGMRVKYRYGEATVPYDIEKATTMLAAIQLIRNEDRSVLVPEGSTNLPYQNKIAGWERNISKLLSNRIEIKS